MVLFLWVFCCIWFCLYFCSCICKISFTDGILLWKQHTRNLLVEKRWTGFPTLLSSCKLCKIRWNVMLSGRYDTWCFMQSYSSSCPISGYCCSIQHSSSFLLNKSNCIRKGGHLDSGWCMLDHCSKPHLFTCLVMQAESKYAYNFDSYVKLQLLFFEADNPDI